MTFQQIKLYQIGTFAAGNRLLDPEQRSVQSRIGPLELDHLGPPGLPRLRRGAGRARTSSTPRCAPRTATWSRSTPRAASRSSPRRTRSRRGSCRGCTRCSATPRPSPPAWPPRCGRTGRDDIRVVGQAGDGGTVDIGFGCLSGMFERNDDVLFVCYDNEGYMNTGVQRSGATPPAARTANTKARRTGAGQRVRTGQDPALDRHGPRDPVRRHRDRRRPARPRGQGGEGDELPRRPLPARARALPARLGRRLRGHDPARPAGHGERAVPGLRGRARRGHRGLHGSGARSRSRTTCDRRRATPTCSATAAGRPDVVARLQARADRNIARFGLAPGRRRLMDKPFAITLDVGSSRANKTGSWRTERAVYINRMPPCNDACPAGEDVQAWLYEAEEGGAGYERAWRQIMEDNPFPADHGPGLLPPVRDRLQPRPARRGGRHQLRRAVPRRRGDPAGLDASPSTAPPTGKRVLVVGAGPVRPVRGLPPGPPRPHRHHQGGRPDGRRHDALRHPDVPAAPRRPRRRGPAHPRPRRHPRARRQGHRPRRDQGRVRRGLPRRRRPARASAPTSRPARPHTCSTRSACCTTSRTGERPLLGRRVAVYGGGNTAIDAARTAKRLGASDAIVVYRRTRDRMPAHESEVAEAEDEGVLFKWLTTIKQVDAGTLVVERMELDETGFPQPTGETDELAADSLVLALGQDTDLSLLGRCTGPGRRGRRRRGRPGPDDRLPRRLRRRRHGAGRALGHGRHRPRQAGGPPHRRLAVGRRARARDAEPALAHVRHPQHLVLRGRPPQRTGRVLERARRESTFDEVVHGLDEAHRAARGAAVPVVRQLLRLRQLLRRLSRTTRCSSSGTPGRART